jgi:hypothetical protein
MYALLEGEGQNIEKNGGMENDFPYIGKAWLPNGLNGSSLATEPCLHQSWTTTFRNRLAGSVVLSSVSFP